MQHPAAFSRPGTNHLRNDRQYISYCQAYYISVIHSYMVRPERSDSEANSRSGPSQGTRYNAVLVARILLERGHDRDSLRRVMQLARRAGGHGRSRVRAADRRRRASRTASKSSWTSRACRSTRCEWCSRTARWSWRAASCRRVCSNSVAFHLAERSFGRFVRAVGVSGAFDAARAARIAHRRRAPHRPAAHRGTARSRHPHRGHRRLIRPA